MKKILRHYIIDTFTLYLVSRITTGISFLNGWESLFIAGVGMTVVSLLAKPIINVLLLPLNLITFGLFRWVSSAAALYIVTLVVPSFVIKNFGFAGFSTKWFDLPSLNFAGFLAFIAFSFVISFIGSIIYWIIK